MSMSSLQHALPTRSGLDRARSHSRKFYLVLGAAELVLGLIAIIWPAVTAVSIAILLGILLLIQGGIALVAALFSRGWQLFGRLVVSFVSGLVGLYLLVFPDEGVIGLTAILAILMIFAGVSFLATGLLGDERRGLLILVGILDLVVGVLIWAELPSSASWAVGLLVGFHFLARGFETVSMGFATYDREGADTRVRVD